MALSIYSTLSRTQAPFAPIEPNHVRMYVCGVTVYDYCHIGHGRTFVAFDVVRRWLEASGMKVTFVRNITDVDDKIIRRAAERGITTTELTEEFGRAMQEDMLALGCLAPTHEPRATDYIPEMLGLIEKLEQKGYAYQGSDGDVDFAVRKFENYGRLSGKSIDDLQSGARVDVAAGKRDPLDFVLWKSAKPGEPQWESKWGCGRPGWHIECSAMSAKILGDTFDIHGGGPDLIFPHHENEIAQSECFTGKPFAHYWMHNGYINVDNVKMSKSLGNFFTVRDVAEKYGYEPIRYLLISAQYRSPINYSTDIIEQCISALNRLYTCRDSLDFELKNAVDAEHDGDKAIIDGFDKYREQFISAMDDDLNTADAIASIFELVRDINTNVVGKTPSKALVEGAIAMFDELTGVLGLVYNRKTETLDSDVEALIEARTNARKEKNWAEADRIRDQLKEMGIVLEDTAQGVKWHRE